MWITRAVGIVTMAILVVLTFFDVAAVAGQNTKFSFPSGFRDPDKGNMSVSGDASNLGDSYYMNTASLSQGSTTASCGRVVYKDKIRMVNNATRTVASFKTAFSFSFQSGGQVTCGDGMVFAFYTNSDIGDVERSRSGGSFCVLNSTDFNGTERVFAVEIDSYNNYHSTHVYPFSDYGDSHIAVDLGTKNLTSCPSNADSSLYYCENQYNLCSNSHYFDEVNSTNTGMCSFFCGNGSTHTAWIDYNSTEQLLEVWFRNNGSLSSGIQKPAAAIITVPNLRLGEILDDEVYVGFTASTGTMHEAHAIQAWEFESSGMPSPTSPAPSPAQSPSSLQQNPEPKSRPVGLIAGVACAALAAAILAGLSLYFCKRANSLKNLELISSLEVTETSRTYTYRELSRATKNFSASELLSSGAFGDVYRGTLPSGALVAIKRIKEDKEQGQESFLAEATSLKQIRHRNLLQLRGWSHTREGLFLVYDYMSNGSLDKWIYRNRNRDVNADVKAFSLSWDVRQSILAGVASGLEYLHEGWVKCVLHRDIKSSNVLLDADFNACLGDFGLARLIDHNKLQRTTLLAGTLGYMAPEMMHTGRATKETDVYAFGIMVLEVVCGRRPLDMQAATNPADYVLLDSVWRAHEAGNISRMSDVRLLEVETSNPAEGATADGLVPDLADTFEAKMMREMMVTNMLHLGLLCCLPDPSERPSMRAVNRWFQSSKEGTMDQLPPLPAAKPHYIHSSEPASSSSGGTSSWSQSSNSTKQRSTPSDNGSFAKPLLVAT